MTPGASFRFSQARAVPLREELCFEGVTVKAGSVAVMLAVFATLSLTPPILAQGVIANYTIHIDFFDYACSLDITQVSLYDSSGQLVAVASSPYGGEIAVSVNTATPILALTATAYGQATWSSYYSWEVSGSRTISLGSSGDYWITIRMS